jgi:hypothetical protein
MQKKIVVACCLFMFFGLTYITENMHARGKGK